MSDILSIAVPLLLCLSLTYLKGRWDQKHADDRRHHRAAVQALRSPEAKPLYQRRL